MSQLKMPSPQARHPGMALKASLGPLKVTQRDHGLLLALKASLGPVKVTHRDHGQGPTWLDLSMDKALHGRT